MSESMDNDQRTRFLLVRGLLSTLGSVILVNTRATYCKNLRPIVNHRHSPTDRCRHNRSVRVVTRRTQGILMMLKLLTPPPKSHFVVRRWHGVTEVLGHWLYSR